MGVFKSSSVIDFAIKLLSPTATWKAVLCSSEDFGREVGTRASEPLR
jgi:hypothetical protein